MWQEDGEWYAAVVHSHEAAANSYTVHFTEYGNMQSDTPADQMRSVKKKTAASPEPAAESVAAVSVAVDTR